MEPKKIKELKIWWNWIKIHWLKALGYLFALLLVTLILGPLISNFFGEKGKQLASKADNQIKRPYLDIEPDEIEYTEWSEKEKKDDPQITSSCDKILLHFWIHNRSDYPANNVDVKATSFVIKEKDVGKFTPKNIKNSYEHNLHLVIKDDSGRQPFVLALDKKAVKYFKDGAIKIKIVVHVTYNGLNDNIKYWNEEAYLYSPTFKKFAKEIYSKGR